MFKVVTFFVVLTIIQYVNSSAIRGYQRSVVLEETNLHTIRNERDSYLGREKLNLLARESHFGGLAERRRIRRDERFESAENVRRSDSEYQAFLGNDFILPDNWRSLYSSAGLRKLSPCSSKK